jgi:hypothetical protein
VAVAVFGAAVFAIATYARRISTLSATESARLPGMLTTRAPWPGNTALLGERLDRLGLPPAGGIEHVHVFLAIFVDGRRVAIPANIGLTAATEAALHVHAGEPGIVHVESLVPFWRPTLGEFFDVWGVRLSSNCLGGYCSAGDARLVVFVDGKRVADDPRSVPLIDRTTITIAFGSPGNVPDPLPSYDWPS